MEAHRSPSILSGLSVFSQLIGPAGRLRTHQGHGFEHGLRGDSTNKGTDLCSLSAVVKNPGKIKDGTELFIHICSVISTLLLLDTI